MSNTAFSTSSANPILAQPAPGGAFVILRNGSSTGDAAVGLVASYTGVVGAYGATVPPMIELWPTFSVPLDRIYQMSIDSPALGVVTVLSPGVSAVGDVEILTQPSNNDTISFGPSGNAITYRFVTTLSAEWDVLIGSDKEQTLTHLCSCINSLGSSNVDYWGLGEDPHCRATIDTVVMTITDLLACNRISPWVMSQSAPNFGLRVPRGGVDGAVLARIPVGLTVAASPLVFSTEDHSAPTLPTAMTVVSDYVATGGQPVTIRTWTDNALTVKFQSSTDLLNWHDTSEGEITLTASILEYHALVNPVEYLRMIVVTNSSGSDSKLDARVIY